MNTQEQIIRDFLALELPPGYSQDEVDKSSVLKDMYNTSYGLEGAEDCGKVYFELRETLSLPDLVKLSTLFDKYEGELIAYGEMYTPTQCLILWAKG